MTPPSSASTPEASQKDEAEVDSKKSAAPASTKGFRFTLSEGILLGILSASAYLLTFQYERGFASHFGIPTQFISVNLVNVLFIGALVIGTLFFAILIVNALVLTFFPRISSHPILLRHATTVLLLMPTALFPGYVYGTWLSWIFGLGTLSFVVLYLFALPVLLNREGDYVKKLEAQAKKDQNDAATTLFGLASRRFGQNSTLAVWFLLGSFLCAYYAGDAAAMNQKEFLITASPQTLVLLRRYGDDLVFAPLNRDTKEVQKSFIIIRVDELTTALSVEDVGPLKPVPLKSLGQQPIASPSVEPQSSPS